MKYQTLSKLVSNVFLVVKMKVLGYNSLDEQAFLKEQVLVEVQEPSWNDKTGVTQASEPSKIAFHSL
jgi:hypothetical protein